MRMVDNIVKVLENLGGVAHINQIVEKIPEKDSLSDKAASVRATIYRHSSDCDAYLGKEDLFYSADGIGKGRWGLRNMSKDNSNKNNLKIDNVDENFENGLNNGQIEFITFHPSYSYEDFIEGIRPKLRDKNSELHDVEFELKEGVFKLICARALYAASTGTIKKDVLWDEALKEYSKAKDDEKVDWESHKFVIIIDEINRGDVSKIFGELITLIEEDKRMGNNFPLTVKLPYSGDLFSVPKNLSIVGTMNTADRSLSLIDIALRRRFSFIEMKPKFKIFDKDSSEKHGSENVSETRFFQNSIRALENLNEELGSNPDIGKGKKIGHAYLCNLVNEEEIRTVWKDKILPLIEEYYFFDLDKLENISNKIYTKSDGWDFYRIDEFVDFLISKKELKE